MKNITTIGVIISFIISMLATPMALAASSTASGSLVGVVYRGWTQQECQSTFGNYKYITNTIDGLNLAGADTAVIKARGPLMHNNVETGCYCGREDLGGGKFKDYMMNDQKTGCQTCVFYDKSAVYYTDTDNAVPSAVITANGVDVGCRCAKKEQSGANAGNKDFDKVVDNKCTYLDTTKQKDACHLQFGNDGVSVCTPGSTTQDMLGQVVADGKSVDCCCDSGYTKQADSTKPGKFKCAKGLTTNTTQGSQLCQQFGKNFGLGDKLVECPDSVVPVPDGKYDASKATDAAKQTFARSYMGQYGSYTSGTQLKNLHCCCPTDQIKANGKCVDQVDDCGKIVPGSVMGWREDKDTSLQITAGYVSPYDGKTWDPAKLKKIQEGKTADGQPLDCYCKTETIPYAGKSPNLQECKAGVKDKDVLFIGKTADQFIDMFDNGNADDENVAFNAIKLRSEAGQNQNVVSIPYVSSGPYKGGVLITDSGELSFYNDNVNRNLKIGLEIGLAILEMGAGSLLSGLAGRASGLAARGATTVVEGMAVDEVLAAGTARAAGKTLAQYVAEASGDAAAGVAAAARAAALPALESTDAALVAGAKGIGTGLATEATAAARAAAATGADAGAAAVARVGFGDEALTQVVKMAKARGLVSRTTLETPATGQAILENLNGIAAGDAAKTEALEEILGRASLYEKAVAKKTAEFAAQVGAGATGGFLGGVGDANAQIIAKAEAMAGPLGQVLRRIPIRAGVALTSVWDDDWLGSIPMMARVMKSIKNYLLVGSGAIGGAIALSWAGPIGWAVGAVAGGAANYFVQKVDPVTMKIKWNGEDKRTVEQLLLINDIQNCGKGPKGSGLKFIPQSYSGSTIRGWAMTQWVYTAKQCSVLGTHAETTLVPVGQEISCTGCSVIPKGSMCGQTSSSYQKNDKIVGDAICCQECIRLDNVEIAEYENMPALPSEAGQGGQGPITVSQ